ncbi:hypothetical protein Mycsm_07187 (plasmid) [Mycobacterium sp. JS623]|uniref:hypothetical protein n=1 Tax=Mycobacterium sp. JS623 TaxID=212767 RepID=UPI0002A5BA34|nr:hypothetical protein [Mycobacterium sp. JS623]AGB27281.1 hypothetical protein Mycsm_07187 [Mycobacterium sp. JS623]
MRLVSPGEWMSHSRWFRRDLSAERIGEILSFDKRTRPLLHDFLNAYPPRLHNETRWSYADIFQWVNESADPRGTLGLMPRLFPVPDAPRRPARMLFATSVEVGAGGQEFVVHAWEPSDGRGHVAVGYPVRDCPGATNPETAQRLLGHLSWASAVAIPTGDDAPTGNRGVQPAVWVADGRPVVLGGGDDDLPAGVERCVWGDVANLLRTDLPWWPHGLRERDAMLMWRPGDDPLAITPATAERDPAALLDILTPDSSTGLRHTIAKMIRTIEHDLCGQFVGGRDQYAPFPGLTHAAFPAIGNDSTPQPRTPGEAALFLHQRVPNPLIAARAATVAGGYPVAHLTYVIKPTNRQHPLVDEWLTRLRPASTSRRDEIGYQLALSMLPVELGPDDHLAPTGFHVDPDWPDCWIVSLGETVIVTCGVSVPARGVLRQAYLAEGAAFFRDSLGGVWPLPCKRYRPTDTDEDLAQTLTRLLVDAGADVESPDAAVETNLLLWQQIQASPLPIAIHADEVMPHRQA